MQKDEDLVYSVLEVLEIPHKETEKIPGSPEAHKVSIKKEI